MALMSPTRPEDQLQMTMGTQPEQLGMVQHPMHAMIAPLEPAPPELDPALAMGMSPDQPDTSKFQQPKIKQMSATDQYKEKLAQKQMSDLQKDENPYGSANNHPGFFGKLLHGLSVATGGPNRRQFAEAERNNQIQGIEKEQGAQEQQQAQTQEAQARTENLRNPQDKFTTLDTDQGEMRFDPRTGEIEPLTIGGQQLHGPDKQATPILHETDQGLMLVDPITKQVTPLTLNGQPLMPNQKQGNLQQVTTLGPDGKPHTYGVNTQGQKVVDYGVHYERPITVNTGEKEFEYSDKALTAVAKPIEDLAMRMGRLKDTMAQGTPQADALVAPELLTVMAGGQGSGLRMNEAEIARIVGGRSAWENLKASVQHWSLDPSSARSITPEQDRQIRALIQHVDGKMQQKLGILNDARSKLVDVADPREQHRLVAQTRQALQGIDTENGGTVKMQAPNGSIADVPLDQVEHYKSLGAKEIR